MAKKLPYMQFYTGDWLKDPAVSRCSSAARGVWIDLLCAMHESGRVGSLCGTTDELSRIARCSPAELTHALTVLQATGAADVVTIRNGQVTVTNRRMAREHKSRQQAALRQQRFKGGRKTAESNGGVTTPITSSSISSSLPNGNISRGFVPPTVDEVAAYCKQRGNSVDAQRFIDHYTSNGWRVGRNPMKDWQAAVRTWERNTIGEPRQPGQAMRPQLPDITDADLERVRSGA